jgi:hypothetical protein
MKITKEEIRKQLKKCGEISYPSEERLLYNHFIDYVIDKTDLIKIDEYEDYNYYATVQYNKIISELKELSIKTKITRELIDSLFFIYSLKIEKVIKDEVKYKDFYSLTTNKQTLNKLLLKGDSWKELLKEALVNTKENGTIFNYNYGFNSTKNNECFKNTPLGNFVETSNSFDNPKKEVILNESIEFLKNKKHTSKKDMLETFFHILLNGGYKEEIQNMFNKFKELDKNDSTKRSDRSDVPKGLYEDFITKILDDNYFNTKEKYDILKRDGFKSYEILILRNKNKLSEILELSETLFDKLTLLDLIELEKSDLDVTDYVLKLKESKKITDSPSIENDFFVDKYNFEDELDGVPLADYVFVNELSMKNFRLGLEVTNPNINKFNHKGLFEVDNKSEVKQ